MNLKNLKVEELNSNELKKVDGGLWREVAAYLFEKFLEDPTKFVNPNAHTYKLGHMGGGRP